MYIITGNKGKLAEYQTFFPGISPMELDLPEIQELDEYKVQKSKIEAALKYLPGDFVIDEVSFYLDCIPGLPGPFIKWFNYTIKPEGIYELASKYDNYKASAKCIISYVESNDKVFHFEGVVDGEIVLPRQEGLQGFGFDKIFQPLGLDRTYAEMDKEEKNKISHRGIALQKLSDFLKNNT